MFNPAHPGELIRETIDGIIEATGRKLTVEEVAIGSAIKLSTGFSNTTAEFWLQVQDNYDLFQD